MGPLQAQTNKHPTAERSGQTGLRFIARQPVQNESSKGPSELRSETPPVVLRTPEVQSTAALTLADLESMALANNPTLAQAAARLRAAQGRWLQAGLYPNPLVGYQGSEIGNEGRAGQQGGYVGQEFVTGGKLRLSRNIAAQEISQAQAQLETQRLRVLNDVRIQYYDVLVAQRTVELSEELVRIGERASRTADELFKAQEASRVDLLQARVELNTARIALQNARNRYVTAWRVIGAVVGVPHLAPTPLAGDLQFGIRDLTWDESLARLLATIP